ncbi:MAG: phosphonate ABC transporter, permease protein PhnE [Nitrososphaerota archaeon]|nr:phosphonate ABC transporter, permease protein PhnE [Candidatus Calditenuaceae archaeon]MDW8073588.1 phosphonate ABC transporter, permease protein PhnE [Nitrososphaerota archaeon]
MKLRIVILVLFVLSLWQVGFFDPSRIAKVQNIGPFLAEMLPPDLTIMPLILTSIYESIVMAFAGTLMGSALALILAVFSSRLLAPTPVKAVFRTILALIRTIPAILWALFFVVVAGFGPFAGVLALTFYTTGYLGKLFYEAFDSVSSEVLEAVRGVGASRLQQLRYAILPESANYILSQLLFIFEYNVRASSIVGLVGAGGVGYLILALTHSLRYSSLLTTILVLLAFVLAIDLASSKIRAKYFT